MTCHCQHSAVGFCAHCAGFAVDRGHLGAKSVSAVDPFVRAVVGAPAGRDWRASVRDDFDLDFDLDFDFDSQFFSLVQYGLE